MKNAINKIGNILDKIDIIGKTMTCIQEDEDKELEKWKKKHDELKTYLKLDSALSHKWLFGIQPTQKDIYKILGTNIEQHSKNIQDKLRIDFSFSQEQVQQVVKNIGHDPYSFILRKLIKDIHRQYENMVFEKTIGKYAFEFLMSGKKTTQEGLLSYIEDWTELTEKEEIEKKY